MTDWWNRRSEDLHKPNVERLVDPTVTDDSSKGFPVGSHWTNTVLGSTYVCVDNTVGAAIWKINTQGGSGVFNSLDIDQASETGAIPVVTLDQADVSEEFVRFDAVEGVGNPVEDVGAKTLTTTKFVKVNINGVDLYIQVGTIA